MNEISRPLFLWLTFTIIAWSPLSIAAKDLKISPEYQKQIERVLASAGANRAELVKALTEVPGDQTKGMQFLIAYMPESDSKSLTAKFLLENVKWAYHARETYPWAKKVPEDLFFNDVLPYAVLNERRDDWREDFFNRFSQHVKDSKTQAEALKAVSEAIQKELKVEYNTKRKKPDQSPYESMEIGMASCTGLSILLCDAFRAIGIPSRVVGIPMWTTKKGNHNWVEVWTVDQKKWQFTEYYFDKKGLDHAWFVADAGKANEKSFYHSIYASSWKPTGKHFPLVWDMKRKDVHAVNVTRRYVERGGEDRSENFCELRIHFMKNKQRVAVRVTVMQGDLTLRRGISPKPTEDMNRYLTVKVGKGQIYQIVWKDPETGKVKQTSITTPKDKGWFTVDLAK
ncbi:MAG: transglutaminase family protein [Akkermansiaceae bacterium]